MSKVISLIKTGVGHELVSGSFYVFLGTTFSSFLAFLLNIYFARSLSYAEYGIYSALLSLITLFIIPASSLAAVIVKYATGFFARGENERAGAFYKKSFKYLLLLSILFIAIFILMSPVINSFLKINDIALLFLTGASVSVFYLANLNIAFIQSLLKFKYLGFVYSLAGVGKLISGVILILLGFNIYGALLATFIFSLLDFLFSLFPLKDTIKKAGKTVEIGTKEFTRYAVPTSLAIISLSSFISTDVLLVKHFFSPDVAGLYGGLSLVGKVIFYFTGPIAIAMFPLIVKRHEMNVKYNNLFYIALLLVLVPSVLITGFYFLFPSLTIQIFLGGQAYLSMTPLLGIFGVFLTIFSINNLFVNFFLSIKKTGVFVIVFFTALIQILGIYLFHTNFSEVISVSIATSLLLLSLLVLYYLNLNRSVVKRS